MWREKRSGNTVMVSIASEPQIRVRGGMKRERLKPEKRAV
jgi:hypothetical protein